jgi:hypothetical protein
MEYLSSLHEKHESWFKPSLQPGELLTPKVSRHLSGLHRIHSPVVLCDSSGEAVSAYREWCSQPTLHRTGASFHSTPISRWCANTLCSNRCFSWHRFLLRNETSAALHSD